MKSIEEIINFILYPEFKGWLLIIKIIFLGFLVFFSGFIIWALFNTTWLKRIFLSDFKEFLFYRPIEIEKYKKKWEKIKERISLELEAEIKLALLEADELLNEVLEEKGYRGRNFEERIQKLSVVEAPIDLSEILKAHKLRDDIVHDPSLRVELKEIQKAISIYEEILKRLDAI